MATRKGEMDTVKRLVNEGADINTKDNNGVSVTILDR